MPLVRRPNPSWQAFQEVLPGTPTGGPRSSLAAGWPTELPDPRPGATPALQAASLPRLTAQPGTAPVRGRPTRPQLGLGAAPTGAPSTTNGRSSIFSMPTY
ncbi:MULTISPECIES: hypothetical protein [unclassified Streptomyces]|uniref:hypothetical protein n=1 Tax=unclassified Streptomyces TaxID=2593676 RepID=UPI002E29273B|nr:hypothetical protein [Streptomyces sp. NBC_00285]